MRNKWLFLILLICCVVGFIVQQDFFIVLDVSLGNGLIYSQEGGNEWWVFVGIMVKVLGWLWLLQGVSVVIVFEDIWIMLKGLAMYDFEQLGVDICS